MKARVNAKVGMRLSASLVVKVTGCGCVSASVRIRVKMVLVREHVGGG